MTASQWARFAFLVIRSNIGHVTLILFFFIQRKSLVTFNELVLESMVKTVAVAHSGQSSDAIEGDSSVCEPNERSDETESRDWVQADFWEFVDALLGNLHAAAADSAESPDEQKKYLEKWVWLIVSCMQII